MSMRNPTSKELLIRLDERVGNIEKKVDDHMAVHRKISISIFGATLSAVLAFASAILASFCRRS